jgi:hypothetical protein
LSRETAKKHCLAVTGCMDDLSNGTRITHGLYHGASALVKEAWTSNKLEERS